MKKTFVDSALGKKFGRLTPIEIVPGDRRRLLKCSCDCGVVFVADPRMLKRGDTTSCGCFRRESQSDRRKADLVGKVFGRLTVVGIGNSKLVGRNKVRNYAWICTCECGSTIELTSNTLLSGNTKSCGCYNKERTGERYTTSTIETVATILASRVSRRGIDWSLSKQETVEVIVNNCDYCGTPPDRLYKGVHRYHGLDRIDSSLPYTKDNVVACCKTCNFAKNSLSVDEFKQWLERAYNHLIKKDS